jgi:diguanylate cyclase (GGDEF)-like protein
MQEVMRSHASQRARFGDSDHAMRAVSRLLGAASEGGPAPVQERLVQEVRGLFDADAAALLSVAEPEGLVEVGATDPMGDSPHGLVAIDDLPAVGELFAQHAAALRLTDKTATELGQSLGLEGELRSALLVLLRRRTPVADLLVIADGDPDRFGPQEIDVAKAFADGATIGLDLLQLSEQRAAQTARQAALARAARTLNDSLDPGLVLLRICEEAAGVLSADNAAVYLGDGRHDLRAEAVFGYPHEAIGTSIAPGDGLSGKVAEHDEPMLTNDYQSMPRKAAPAYIADIRSALAVPMHWWGELRGVLTVNYTRPYLVTRQHLALLETFGELAAVACRNAAAHAGAVVAAKTDALTGCLNHAGFHEALARELERSRRSGKPVSLALVDLDDFKGVNEEHGHLAGDEVLRQISDALRRGVRPYDVVGRYGGDEFAIVAAEANEREATEVTTRALGAVVAKRVELPYVCAATAGVAQWDGEESQDRLIDRADHALLHGKHSGRRGVANRASDDQPALSDSR